MFFIFTKYSNFLFIMNNLNSLKGFFFLQKFYTQTAKLPSISIQIKNKKSAFKRFFFLKKKKYLFSSRFKYNYLTKFKFFTKISKVKNVNLLKSPKTFFFNFHSTPHLSFFYKKFYPLTGFFLNSLSFPHFSFISEKENDAAAFLDDSVLNDLFTIKKIKIKRKKKSFSKLIKFKHFKKLLLSDIFYVSKKNYFWNFFFNKKNIKLNRAIATLSNFNSLPYSKAGLALSLNYKKNTHDLDKIILFSCELLLSSFLQFRSFFLRKKRYFRKSSAPYNARLLFGVKTRLPNFKKKLFKFNTFSRFLFKKAPLSYNTFKQNKFFSKRQSTALKPKFLLKTFSKFLKKKNYKLLNKILKDKNKFVKLRTFFLKSKNLRNKLNTRFLMLKHRFFFKKKKKLNKKNKPLMRFVSLFFVNLFFKSLKLKKKPATARLSKYRKKSLRKKFKRFMNYLKIKRKSPSATRRSKRILKRKFRAISFRILKSSLIKFKFFT